MKVSKKRILFNMKVSIMHIWCEVQGLSNDGNKEDICWNVSGNKEQYFSSGIQNSSYDQLSK